MASQGAIHIGADADLLIADMDREWTVDRRWLQSRHKHSPFLGRSMKGWIDLVLRRGQTLAQNGEIAVDGGGVWLRPNGETVKRFRS